MSPFQQPIDESSHLLGHQANQLTEGHNLWYQTPGCHFLPLSNLRTSVSDIKKLCKDSLPVIFAYSLQNSLQTCSLIIVGQTSPENLATAAFAYMFASCTGWLIALGGTTALDTLASSAFTGASDHHELGVLLQRAFLILGLMYFPITVLWAFSEPLFVALGQDASLARDASNFLTCLIPGGLGFIYFETMKKFLQAQGLMSPGIYVLILITPINIGLNYAFCYSLRLGLLAAPMATGISYWLCFPLIVLYTMFWDGHQCWGGLSRRMFQDLSKFAHLAFLGVVHVGAEWWAFEIVAIAAGWLGTIPMATQSIIMTADQVLNTVPFGIGVAASSHVGNRLGSRDSHGASRAASAAIWLSVSFGFAMMLILIGSRFHLAKAFTQDSDVVELTAKVIPYLAVFQIADGLNGSCGGCLRGVGRQKSGAIINLFSYYILAIPLGVWLSRHGHGLVGLWLGPCLGLYVAGLIELAVVSSINWHREFKTAFLRMETTLLSDSDTV